MGVSGRYFDTLGVGPALGRVVGARDVDSVSPVATISFRCWQTRFGADPNVIGQTFRLQGELVTVIGVAPHAFAGLEVGVPADAWVPASLAPRLLNLPPGLSFFDGARGPAASGCHASAGAGTRSNHSGRRRARPRLRTVAAALGKARDDDTLALQPQVESAARGFSDLDTELAIGALWGCWCCSARSPSCWPARISRACCSRDGRRERAILRCRRRSARPTDAWCPRSSANRWPCRWSRSCSALHSPCGRRRASTLLLWNNPDATAPLDLSPDYRVIGLMVGLAGLVAVCVSLLPASRIWSAKLS